VNTQKMTLSLLDVFSSVKVVMVVSFLIRYKGAGLRRYIRCANTAIARGNCVKAF